MLGEISTRSRLDLGEISTRSRLELAAPRIAVCAERELAHCGEGSCTAARVGELPETTDTASASHPTQRHEEPRQ